MVRSKHRAYLSLFARPNRLTAWPCRKQQQEQQQQNRALIHRFEDHVIKKADGVTVTLHMVRISEVCSEQKRQQQQQQQNQNHATKARTRTSTKV